MRLNKYIALCGVASRRDADKLIENGEVYIDGHVASLGEPVNEDSVVEIHGKVVKPCESRTVIAFNKPRGYVVTERAEHNEKTIYDVFKYPKRLTYAGRLDKDSEGLLIMTDDGDLINACMKGINNHDKEYVVRTDRTLTDEEIEKFKNGLFLEELQVTTRPCKIKALGRQTYSVTITQGLNRQIRRMFNALGVKVYRLKRIRIVNVLLKDIKPGEYREITGEELDLLYKNVGLNR